MTRRGLKRWKSIFVLLVAVGIFGWFFSLQERSLSANRAIDTLVFERELLLLESGWNVTLQVCADAGEPCHDVGHSGGPVQFPAVNETAQYVRTAKEPPTHAVISRPLTSVETEWLGRVERPLFVIPRSQMGTVLTGGILVRHEGNGILIRPHDSLLAEWRTGVVPIELKFRVADLPWFGPADSPFALATSDAALRYARIDETQRSADLVYRVMIVTLALVVAMFATFLNQNPLFERLSWCALVDALRTLFTLMAGGNMGWLIWANELVNVFAMVAYLSLSIELMRLAPPRLFLPLLSLGSVLTLVVLGAVFPSWFVISDLVWDGMSTMVCAILIAVVWVGRSVGWMGSAGQPTAHSDFFSLPRPLLNLRVVLVLTGFLGAAWVNLSTLIGTELAIFREALTWQNIIFLPLLTSGVLIETAFFGTRQKAASREIRKKILLEQEITLGKALLRKMMPPRKREEDGLYWRILHSPASQIAGDWCDVRVLRFPGENNRRLLFSCVVDVAGHGLQAGVNTTVVSAVIGGWADAVTNRQEPVSAETVSLELKTLARDMAKAFIAMRETTAATAVFAILDPEGLELYYLTAGHPAPMMIRGEKIEILEQPRGGLLGVSGSVKQGAWTITRVPVEKDDRVLLVSDGLLDGKSRVSWHRTLLKQQQGVPSPVIRQIWNLARKQKLQWRVEGENNEDDITAVILGCR
jgi:hypothetical protein